MTEVLITSPPEAASFDRRELLRIQAERTIDPAEELAKLDALDAQAAADAETAKAQAAQAVADLLPIYQAKREETDTRLLAAAASHTELRAMREHLDDAYRLARKYGADIPPAPDPWLMPEGARLLGGRA